MASTDTDSLDTDPKKAEILKRLQAEVDKRIANYKKTRLEVCRNEALEKASAIVDSILIVEAREARLFVKDKPAKPDRPGKPEIKTVIDTIPIAPFLDFTQDSLLRDSLLRDSLRKDSIVKRKIRGY